jgi:dynein light intermediate chain
MSAVGPAKDSLVKYDVPVQVVGNKRKPKASGGGGSSSSSGGVPKLDRRVQLPSTEDVLNAILPPREWSHDGQLWVQHVASTPATRIDVVNLQVRALRAIPVLVQASLGTDIS